VFELFAIRKILVHNSFFARLVFCEMMRSCLNEQAIFIMRINDATTYTTDEVIAQRICYEKPMPVFKIFNSNSFGFFNCNAYLLKKGREEFSVSFFNLAIINLRTTEMNNRWLKSFIE